MIGDSTPGFVEFCSNTNEDGQLLSEHHCYVLLESRRRKPDRRELQGMRLAPSFSPKTASSSLNRLVALTCIEFEQTWGAHSLMSRDVFGGASRSLIDADCVGFIALHLETEGLGITHLH